ncbi:uncharacterized protein MONOS_17434 [Monocercomonoides exilis]|uniref:uncharacterized protein n=1 Tax=Monocercomonoides exilis TaxID=2049356 RepID=UPI00355A5633|nr:hypothetical protein MONOS_17434 [Monocercomonoides exilis]
MMFTLWSSFEIDVVGCTLQKLDTEGCKKGGSMSFEKKAEVGQLKMRNEGATNRKGGFLHQSYRNSIDAFSLTDLVYSDNEVYDGNNMFTPSSDLNDSVVIERLTFDWTEWKSPNAFFGADEENEGSIDLVPFIVFKKSERIFVSGEKGKNEKDCERMENT